MRDNQGMPQFTDQHGVNITYYEWLVPKPKAVIQLLHGVGEHAVRYAEFAKAMNAAGYSVVADDHRGHGQTGHLQWAGDTAKYGKLGPGGLRATEDAIEQLTVMIRQQNPGVPVVLFGHSWGSLMAQRIINRSPKAYDALVLSGSAFRMPGSMEGGDLNKHHKDLGDTGFEWLSSDPDTVTAFVADPLTFGGRVINLFGLWDSLKLFGLPSKKLPRSLPLYIFSGSEDPLSIGSSLNKLAASYRKRAGLTDVTLRTYESGRHEMLNEVNRSEVFADVASWLDEHFGVNL